MGALKRRQGLWPMLALFGLLLVSLVLLSDATQNSAQFGRLYSWLLLINLGALVVLAVLIGINLYSLVHQYRAGAAGSRLTVRLVAVFVVLAVVPVSIVYYVSVQFLQEGIDSWFDVRIERSLEDALELSRSALDDRMRERLRKSQSIAADMADVSDGLLPLTLNDARANAEATEITLFDRDGQVVATSTTEPSSSLVPHRPPDNVLLQIRDGRPYVGLDPVTELGLHIRTVVPVPSASPKQGNRVLQVLYPIAERINNLADSVQRGATEYKELAYLRKPLKRSFVLTLSFVLLLSLLAAVWAAFYSARRLVEPVRELAEGTKAVSEGRYDTQLTISSNDELGFLVRSFNTMIQRLAQARDTASRSQRQAESQRAYLEAVLSRLSSGVLTLDWQNRLRTVNTAAGQILGLDLQEHLGEDLDALVRERPYLNRLVESLKPYLEQAHGEWREEIVLFGAAGRQILMCRGSTLPGPQERHGGHVIVFDDITELVQAQRDAAWAEVARRLAHEIKNPLTPIQLSAERLRHKYLDAKTETDTAVLDRATHTIVQQVEAMKEMVNAFTQYARPTELSLEPIEVNGFVNEVLDLYRGQSDRLEVSFDGEASLPYVEADRGRLRQLLHNLIKNSIESTAQTDNARLMIRTRCMDESGCRFIELMVEDNGPGFSTSVIAQLFEPYVTTKVKGTGLGLAIVKKIVEEHGGTIRAENTEGGGARIIIRLPVIETATQRPVASLPGDR